MEVDKMEVDKGLHEKGDGDEFYAMLKRKMKLENGGGGGKRKVISFKVEEENGGQLPVKAHESDAGFDLFVSEERIVEAGEFVDLPTAVSMELPEGYWGLIIGRSSTERKRFMRVMPGVIDSGYRGELFVGVTNLYRYPGESVVVRKGDRLAQLIIVPMERMVGMAVPTLGEHERGTNGFGSTGR
jgi:dUTP pyrophosphatase